MFSTTPSSAPASSILLDWETWSVTPTSPRVCLPIAGSGSLADRLGRGGPQLWKSLLISDPQLELTGIRLPRA